MRKVVNINSIPRPVNLNNRKEKIAKKLEEDYAKLEELKRKTKGMLRRY